MSWRRRRRIFDLFDEFFREIEEEFHRLLRDFEWFGREFAEKGEGKTEVYGPYVYGFRIIIGPDGRPKIEEFGNIKRIRGRPTISEEREPLVDVFEEDKDIVVIAEIPGVEKNNIHVRVSDDKRKLIIKASDEKRKYYKEVELPAPVDPSSARASYKNGVLEVRLKKIEPSTKGYDIKVE